MTHDHDHQDVIVENRGGGMGAVLGIIILVVLLAGIWYFGFGPGQGALGFGGTTENGGDVNIDVNLPTLAPEAS